MSPQLVVEVFKLCAIVLILLFISIFLKKRWRVAVFILSSLLIISYPVQLIIRPTVIDNRIAEKVEMLEIYLQKKYPHTNWEIWTMPHHEREYQSGNPYHIGVTFVDEPSVMYFYWVKSLEEIEIVSFSTKDDITELKYYE